jgi:hypothetical protein
LASARSDRHARLLPADSWGRLSILLVGEADLVQYVECPRLGSTGAMGQYGPRPLGHVTERRFMWGQVNVQGKTRPM